MRGAAYVVQLVEGDATLALVNVARYGVVNCTVGDDESALLALALAVDFHADDGEDEALVAAGVGGQHFLEFRVAGDVHVVVLAHAVMRR